MKRKGFVLCALSPTSLKDGRTALMWMAVHDNEKGAKLLLDFRANVNIATPEVRASGS